MIAVTRRKLALLDRLLSLARMRAQVLLPLLAAANAVAQSDAGVGGVDVEELSLESLLDARVEVATRDARTTLEAPNVVLLLTREDVVSSGARDLLEVLQLIPGFSFHQDVAGVVGVGFRSQWGHEGKVLVMVDGIEMNELLYSTTQFGHHILAHSIEKLEVIRGPGSALYGGSAELAVINVVTRQGHTLRGSELAARVAAGPDGLSDWSLGAAVGDRDEGTELEWSIQTAGGQGRRTRGDFTDAFGKTVSLRNEQLDPLFFNVAVSSKRFKARLLVDDYRIGSQSGYGQASPLNGVSNFRSMAADVQGDLPLSPGLTFRPRLQGRIMVPWQATDQLSELFYDKTAARLLASLGLSWSPLEGLVVSGALDGFWDYAWLNDTNLAGYQTQFNGRNNVGYWNLATWLQGQWDNPFVNVTLGGRFEWNSAVGPNLAPRLALTKQVGAFNFKALAAGAFRNPGIENLNLGPNIRSERVRIGEAEVGVALGEVGYWSVNGFYAEMASPIVYGVDPMSGAETYRNGGVISTAGVESMFRLRGKKGALTLTGALAMPVAANDVDTYLVAGRSNPTLLAMPLVKASAFGRFRVNEFVSAGGHAVFLSAREALMTPSEALDGTLVLGHIPPSLLLTLWVGIDKVGLPGLSAQVGLGNIFGANVVFAQPYDGGVPPLPGRGREVFLRFSYAVGGPSK